MIWSPQSWTPSSALYYVQYKDVYTLYSIYAWEFSDADIHFTKSCIYHCFVLFCRKGTILVCFVATQRRVCCSNFYKMLTFERDGDRKLIFAKCELNLNMFTSCTNIVSHSLFIICTIHVQIKSPKFRKVTSIVSLYDQSSNVTSHVNSERWAIYDF